MTGWLDRLGWHHVPVWASVALLVAASLVVGAALGRLSRLLLARLAGRTSATWDDELVARIGRPLEIAWTVVVAALLVPAAELGPRAALATERVLRASFFVLFFWAALRTVDVTVSALGGSRWASERPGSRAFLPLGGRVGKVLLGVLAIVALLSSLGFSVASLLAGLGIGGLAVALGAQKTLENLFGAFALGVDQPLREGDLVKVEDFLGTVEKIGLRSTRIRTLDRTVISLPNGKLADMRVETFAARDQIRLALDLPLVHGTTAAQLRRVVDDVAAALLAHALIVKPGVTVALKEIGRGSLTVEVSAWFATADWGQFVPIRQELLLRFLEIIEQAGTRLVAPAQTVELSGAAALSALSPTAPARK